MNDNFAVSYKNKHSVIVQSSNCTPWYLQYFEINENGNMPYQILWHAAKTVWRGISITINAYIKKKEKHHVKDLNLFLKELEKDDQTHS